MHFSNIDGIRSYSLFGESQHLPEADVAAYYEAHESSYRAPQRIHVWRILVATAAEAVPQDGAPRRQRRVLSPSKTAVRRSG